MYLTRDRALPAMLRLHFTAWEIWMYSRPSHAPLQGAVNLTVWDHTHVFYM